MFHGRPLAESDARQCQSKEPRAWSDFGRPGCKPSRVQTVRALVPQAVGAWQQQPGELACLYECLALASILQSHYPVPAPSQDPPSRAHFHTCIVLHTSAGRTNIPSKSTCSCTQDRERHTSIPREVESDCRKDDGGKWQRFGGCTASCAAISSSLDGSTAKGAVILGLDDTIHCQTMGNHSWSTGSLYAANSARTRVVYR